MMVFTHLYHVSILTVESCLYPALTRDVQPVPVCSDESSNSVLLSWTDPTITPQCQGQLYAYPTLSYRVTYQVEDVIEQVHLI